MKKLLSIMLAALIVCSAVPMLTLSASADTANSGDVGGFLDRIKNDFNLVFSDEFEGDTLDTTKWQYDGDNTFRNSEAQIYANGPDDGNVYLEDGCVVLKAEKEERTSSSRDKTQQYTSGEISTQGLGSWKYGYFEFSAKLPRGNQVFPAIWLMGYDYELSGCDWPHSGEIDVMEALGGDSDNSVNSTWSTLHYTYYGKYGSGNHVAKGAGTFENLNHEDMTNEFHKYWIYWTDEIIMIGIDDGCYNIVDITVPELAQSFREYEHWILFDLAMGPYGNKINDRPTDDWRFFIDYARVYQLSDEDDYDDYVLIEAEDTVTGNTASKVWSGALPTNLNSDSGGVLSSKFENVADGTYDIYASYSAKAEGKGGVFESYINDMSTGIDINTESSTGVVCGEQGYLGRVTVKDGSTFEIKLKKSSGTATALNIDKFFLVKTDDTMGAVVSDKDNNANLYDEIEVSTADEFYSAFDSIRPSGTIKLKNDITLTKAHTFSTDCTIDLNGFTLNTGTLKTVFSATKSNIKVTLKNGKIQANGQSGVLNNFIIVSGNWDAHYITFEDIAFTSTAKTINSFFAGSWATSNYTLKDCTFDFTASQNDGSTDLYLIKAGNGWNAANTVLNNVTFNYKIANSPISLTGEPKAIIIENCTFNNCKNVIETAAALGTNASIKLANCQFNNIGAFTTFEENIAKITLAENNAYFDKDNNSISLTYDLSGSYKVSCDHSYIEATCTSPATCQYCAHEIGTDKGGHKAGSPVTVKPDCVYAGSVTVSCTECGETLSEEKIHIVDHDYQWVKTVEPTCSQAGYHLYQCSVCNTEQSRSYYGDGKKAKLAHTPDESQTLVVKNTCTSGGYTQKYCTTCKSTYIVDRHASRHTLTKSQVIAPTEMQDGYSIYACEKCDYTVTREFIAAGTLVEHEYSVNELESCSKLIGRAYKDANDVVLAMSGSGVEYGAYVQGDIKVKLNNTVHKSNITHYLGVMIDGDYQNRKLIEISSGDNEITVATDLQAGEHTIMLWHPNEYNYSTYRIKSLTFTGKQSKAPEKKKYTIDFYGDSITVGQGNVPLGEDGSYTSYTSDALDSYAGVVGRELDADINICAASGHGIAYGFNENTNPAGAIISKIYDYASPKDNLLWDYSAYSPDLAVVSLGQNDLTHKANVGDVDYQQELKNKIKDLIEKIRARDKSIPIVWIGGLMNTNGSFSNDFINIRASLSQVVKENDYDNIYFKIIPGDSKGGNYHPSAVAHETIGKALANYIETLDLMNDDTKVFAPLIDDFDTVDSVPSRYSSALSGKSIEISDSPSDDNHSKVLKLDAQSTYSGVVLKTNDIPETAVGIKFDVYVETKATMGVIARNSSDKTLYGSASSLSSIPTGKWVTVTDVFDTSVCSAKDIASYKITTDWTTAGTIYIDNVSYLTLGSTVCEHVVKDGFDKVVPPTCGEDGYTEHLCSKCGERYKDSKTLATGNHIADESLDKTFEPNCTYEGYTEHSCKVCGTVYKDAYKDKVPDAHEIKTMQAKEPTCTESGLTEGKYCELCRSVFVSQQTVDALGHIEIVDEGYAATCTEDGLTDGKHCGREGCGKTLVAQEVILSSGHNTVIDAAVAVTCTKNGLTEGSHCETCGEVFKEQEVIQTEGHDLVKVPITAPTCETDGKTEHTICKTCGEIIFEYQVIAKKGHTLSLVGAKSATYTADGYTGDSVCTVCKKVVTKGKVIPKLKLSRPVVKLKIKNGKLQVKIKKVSGAQKYEVRININGKWKKFNVKKPKLLKKLKSGKKYQVKVRAFVVSNGTKIYSKYSKKMSIKLK